MPATSKGSRKGLIAVIVILTVGLVMLLSVGVFAYTMMDESVDEGTILELTLRGSMPDGPTADPWAELTGEMSTSVFGIRQALRAAVDDDAVAGLLIEVESSAMGMATYDEIVEEIERFAETKPTHVLLRGDMIEDGAYYVSSGASNIWATPHAMWLVNGFQVDVTFWRGTLDKLHIEPEWLMFREYKSAGEPYSRDHMSEYFREALDDVVGDLQRHWFEQVVRRRNLEPATLHTLVNSGMFTTQAALDAGLIDTIGYIDEIRDTLRDLAGTESYQGHALSAYLQQLEQRTDHDHTIALVFGEGPIYATDDNSGPFSNEQAIFGPKVAKHIRAAAKDESVDAIVFRVNSPGGSAVGSDFVWREIQQARAAGTPVIVSMGAVAGSGGYWVSMGADAIVARRTTITGSIGVVFGKFNLNGFYEWIGANVESISYANRAGILSPYDSFTEESRQQVISVIEALYDDFKSKVAEGRSLDPDTVEEIARGRIWSGEDAVELGLVDQLGGLTTSIALAREKAGIDEDAEVNLVVFPAPKNWLELLVEDGVGAQVSTNPVTWLDAVMTELETPRAWVKMPDIEFR